MKMKKPSEDELVRLAFIWAEQDRSSLAAANAGTEWAAQSRRELKWIRDYRLKRWGKTSWEKEVATMRAVDVLSRHR